jgi:hypothetical protein
VDFSLYEKLAPNHQPRYDLTTTIEELKQGLLAMNFKDADFRSSKLMRLKVLTSLQEAKHMDLNLSWV